MTLFCGGHETYGSGNSLVSGRTVAPAVVAPVAGPQLWQRPVPVARRAGRVIRADRQWRALAAGTPGLERAAQVRTCFSAAFFPGGADVARRAFHPRLPVAPQLIDYPFRLPPGLPRVILVNTVRLLPGAPSAELKALGHSVARMSGVSLRTSQRGE